MNLSSLSMNTLLHLLKEKFRINKNKNCNICLFIREELKPLIKRRSSFFF